MADERGAVSRILLGVLGKKRAGKDTLGAALVEHYGFTRFAFADLLKQAMIALDPYVVAEHNGVYVRLRKAVEWHGMERVKNWPDVRRLLQRGGTEMGREVLGQDVWVNALAEQVRRCPGHVVITDVRFPNEADWIRAEGGVLLRVLRSGVDTADTHASEIEADAIPVDFEWGNEGALEDLKDDAGSLLRVIEQQSEWVVSHR